MGKSNRGSGKSNTFKRTSFGGPRGGFNRYESGGGYKGGNRNNNSSRYGLDDEDDDYDDDRSFSRKPKPFSRNTRRFD